MFKERKQEATEHLLSLEQKMNMAEAASSHFEQAYALVVKIAGQVSHSDAWQTAWELLRDAAAQSHQAERLHALREQQDDERLLQEFCQRMGQDYPAEALTAVQQELEAWVETLSATVSEAGERRLTLRQTLEQTTARIEELTTRAPAWLAAQDALTALSEQSIKALTSSRQVTDTMQLLLERERETTVERNEVAGRKRRIEAQIERLSQPGGTEDSRLTSLAEHFGDVLLSEIYDDVTLDDDAPYLSALYGPSRHAIVVPDLLQVREQLDGLEDCSDDLYLIEGNTQSFDDDVFGVEELQGAVLVKVADRQWRYSRFPSMPLFARAARESRLENLTAERDVLAERYATLSFDVQKIQRQH